MLGYRYAPRLADLADHRLWRIDPAANYGPLQGLARNRINTPLIASQWDQICRLAASLEARTVTPSAILRSLQRGPNPSSLGRALAELGRVIKTLHVLNYCHDPIYRRAIHRLLGRGESRNSLARDIFHGRRGQLRQHYQAGQENQLGVLGLMVNMIVLWQTVYIRPPSTTSSPTAMSSTPPTSPGSHRSAIQRSTSTADTGLPAERPAGNYDRSGIPIDQQAFTILHRSSSQANWADR